MNSTILFQVVWLLVASIAASPTGYRYGQKRNPFPDDVKVKNQYGFPTPPDNNTGGHQGLISPVEIVKPYSEPAQKFNLRKQWKNSFQNWDENPSKENQHNGYNNDAENPDNYKNPNNKENNNKDNNSDDINFDNNYQKNGDNTLFRVKTELQAPYPAIIIPVHNSPANQDYQEKQSSPNPESRINRGKLNMIKHAYLNDHKIVKQNFINNILHNTIDKPNHMSGNNIVIPEFGPQYHIEATPEYLSKPKQDNQEKKPSLYPGSWVNTGEPSLINQYLENNEEKHTGHGYDINIGLNQNQIYDYIKHDNLKNVKILKKNLSNDKLDGSKFDRANYISGNNDIVVDVIPEFALKYHTPLLDFKPTKDYGETEPAHDLDTNIGLKQNQIYDHINHHSLNNHKIPKKSLSKDKLDGSNFDKDDHISDDNDSIVDVVPELSPKYHNLLHDSEPKKDYKEPQLGQGYEIKTGLEQTQIIDYTNHNNLNNHEIMNKDLSSDTLNGTNSDKVDHESGGDILLDLIRKENKNKHNDNSSDTNFDNNYQKNGGNTLFRVKPELRAPYPAILIPVQNFPPNQDYQEKKSSSYPDSWINRGEPSMIKHAYLNNHKIIKENFIMDTLDNTIDKADHTSGDNIGILEFDPQYHIKVTPLYHSKLKQDYQEKIPSLYPGSRMNTGDPGQINQNWENYQGKQTGQGYDINIGLKQNQLGFQKNRFFPHLMDMKIKPEHISKPKLGYQENKTSQYATTILIPTSVKDNADEPRQITTVVPVLIEQTGPKEYNYMYLDIANNGHGIATGSLQENKLVNYPGAGNNFEPTKMNISFPLPGYNFQAAEEHNNPKKPLQFDAGSAIKSTTQNRKGYISARTIGIRPNNQQEKNSRGSTGQLMQQNNQLRTSLSMLHPNALVFHPDASMFHPDDSLFHSDALPFSGAALVFNSM